MKKLIEALRDFIMYGIKLSAGHFWFPDWISDLWGYGDDMDKVRAAAIDLGIVST